MPITEHPAPWLARDLQRDSSWIHKLTDNLVAELRAAVRHASNLNKQFLEMTQQDFPLNAAAAKEIRDAFAGVQGRWGLCLMRGFPVREWSEAESRLALWGLALHVGVARPQNKNSDVMNDVRDEGNQYRTREGRGYNTNSKLDFHIDLCDVVALLCRRAARSGGRSLIASSLAVVDELTRVHPECAKALLQPFAMSRVGAQGKGEPPVYLSSLTGVVNGVRAFRINRHSIERGQLDFPEVPRLTSMQMEAVDTVERLLADERFCYSMDLQEGDLQLLNNYVVVHSRTDFEDFDEPDEKRHLLRLWMAVPDSQPLPDDWRDAFHDVRAGAVRGGLRGGQITPAFLAFERRQAEAFDMPNTYVA